METGEGDYACICEEGYYTHNVLDQPVCEATSTTVWLYAAAVFIAAFSIVLSFYHRNRQKKLLKLAGVALEKWSLQDTMRARLYICGFISGSLLSLHYTLLLFNVLTFTQSLPFFAADHFMISELGLVSVETWISLLPRSLLKSESLAFRICGLVQNGTHLWFLSVPFTISYTVGTAMGLFANPVTCKYILQSTICIQMWYSIAIIDVVAYSLLSVMRDAKIRTAKANLTNTLNRSGMLAQARTYDDVMSQVRLMTFGANGLIAFLSVVALFSTFSPVGRRSPLLLYSFSHGFGISVWQIFSVTVLAPKKAQKHIASSKTNTAEMTKSTSLLSPRSLGNTRTSTTSRSSKTSNSSIFVNSARRVLHSSRGTHTRISVSPRNTGTLTEEVVSEGFENDPPMLGGTLESIIDEKPSFSTKSRTSLDTIFMEN